MKHSSIERQEAKAAFVFVAPYFLGLIFFSILPILYSIYMSLTNFNDIGAFKNMKIIGLQNYIDVLKDASAMNSFLKSFYYTLVYVPAMLIFSLVMAIAMNRAFYWRKLSRSLMLMPYVSNIVAVAMIWSLILNPFDGPVNSALKCLGIQNPPLWLSGNGEVLPIVALIGVWMNLAFQAIVYLAALQEVPEELYESAKMDGANGWQKFIKITLPGISPTTFFLLISTIISSTQNFAIVQSLTRGGPGDASEVAAISIYKNAFQFGKYSFASAQSVILFILLLLITVIQWRGQKKWVNY